MSKSATTGSRLGLMSRSKGVFFDNPVLLEWKSQELYSTDCELIYDPVKGAKVREDAKQAFLAYLFFINSNDKKHSQLKKTLANDHAKGDGEAFPSSCHVGALVLMNDFKPLVIKGTPLVAAQGTAFAQKQKGAGTLATSNECNYNQEYFANMECHTCRKKGHQARCCPEKKGKTKKDTDDKKLVSSAKSTKTTKSLTKQVKTLKKLVSALQAHHEDSEDDSSLSSEEGDANFNMHVQSLLQLIQKWLWHSSLIRHGIWISGVYGF